MQPIHISQLTQLRSVHQLGQCGSQLKSGNWGVMNGWIKGKHKQSSIRQSKTHAVSLNSISAVTRQCFDRRCKKCVHWREQKYWNVEPIIRYNCSVVKKQNQVEVLCEKRQSAWVCARFPYVCLWRSGWVTVSHTFAKRSSLVGQTPRVANAETVQYGVTGWDTPQVLPPSSWQRYMHGDVLHGRTLCHIVS